MGTVSLAEDTQLKRAVALKTPSFADETGDVTERFYREARAADKLRHAHICPVHDVGEIDGRHFISMAYIDGEPLSARIKAGRLPTARETLLIVRKIAFALQEATTTASSIAT
jgi:serine/threonine-protein kinase